MRGKTRRKNESKIMVMREGGGTDVDEDDGGEKTQEINQVKKASMHESSYLHNRKRIIRR